MNPPCVVCFKHIRFIKNRLKKCLNLRNHYIKYEEAYLTEWHSIASVARRLGHANMTTTQKTYLHVIQELENQDIGLVMRSLSNLT